MAENKNKLRVPKPVPEETPAVEPKEKKKSKVKTKATDTGRQYIVGNVTDTSIEAVKECINKTDINDTLNSQKGSVNGKKRFEFIQDEENKGGPGAVVITW